MNSFKSKVFNVEQVCSCLGISNESDYFGLKYHSVKAPDVWLNLRNPIERQGVAGVPPYRFCLRVKFWVPPHLLLQDTTSPGRE
ncbi:myosin regulatory light chain interacting protein [Homalodisca vitripennis]|nr:myosin regulatory light chain interacting protein [Homalodisca vitripennis]